MFRLTNWACPRRGAMHGDCSACMTWPGNHALSNCARPLRRMFLLYCRVIVRVSIDPVNQKQGSLKVPFGLPLVVLKRHKPLVTMPNILTSDHGIGPLEL